MNVKVADLALNGVDLSRPETCRGVAVGLDSLADFLLAAQAVVEAAAAATKRQQVMPTRVRLAIALMKATMPEFDPTEGMPE